MSVGGLGWQGLSTFQHPLQMIADKVPGLVFLAASAHFFRGFHCQCRMIAGTGNLAGGVIRSGLVCPLPLRFKPSCFIVLRRHGFTSRTANRLYKCTVTLYCFFVQSFLTVLSGFVRVAPGVYLASVPCSSLTCSSLNRTASFSRLATILSPAANRPASNASASGFSI